MCVCVQGRSTRKTLVSASSEDSREAVRSQESTHPYWWTLFIYHRETGNDGSMNGISSFNAYAQLIYLTCMGDYSRLSGDRHA